MEKEDITCNLPTSETGSECLHQHQHQHPHTIDSVEEHDESSPSSLLIENAQKEVVDMFEDASIQRKLDLQCMNDQFEKLYAEIYRVKSELTVARKDRKQSPDDEWDALNFSDNFRDVFAFITTQPFSFPAFIAWFIFFVQLTCYLLSISKHYIDRFDNTSFSKMPLLDIPKGVDQTVHVGQGMSIFLIIIINDSLWLPVVALSYGFIGPIQSLNVRYVWWLIPNLMRLAEGLTLTLVIFILVIESDDVVELFKDFTAVLFISMFDNMVYALSKLNILGTKMRKAAEACENVDLTFGMTRKATSRNQTDTNPVEEQTPQTCKNVQMFLFNPFRLMLLLLIVMYSVWITYIFIPQRDGTYLCQNIFIQLDDEVDSKLSFFSGSYKIQRGKTKRDFYHTYFETKDGPLDGRTPMTLRYCNERGFWAFSFANDQDRGKECNPDRIFIKSDVVSHQQKFNIFEVSSDDWFVKYPDDGRWMPLNDFYMTCQDRSPKYSVEMYQNICPQIEIDERNGGFVSTRTWSTNFTQLRFPNTGEPVESYNHPIYISSIINNNYDLLMYVGKRWMITSARDLFDMDLYGSIDLSLLAEYLNGTFHGHWSRYKVAFFSEPVLSDTPQDILTPSGLNWFDTINGADGIMKKANDNKQQESILICSLCSNYTNPCFYEGKCLSDNECQCNSGSSGTLCQVLPTGNGFCNERFNNREFNFDGGDCCVNTCVSNDNYLCGSDESSQFYVGFDTCEVETCNDCWRTSISTRSLSFTGLIVTFVTLSPNGKVLALIESVSSTVRVYDMDGSKWIMRGSAVTTSAQPATDKVEVSGMNNIFHQRQFLSPLTVVVKSDTSMHVFDWDEELWKENETFQSQNYSLHVRDIQLRKNGNSMGVLYSDFSFSLFERFDHLTSWREVQSIKPNTYEFFSYADNGMFFLLANRTCLDLYERNENDILDTVCFTKDINKIQLSQGGKSVAVFTKYEGILGDIFTFNIVGSNFEKANRVLRGIPYQDASIGITDEGKNMVVHSSNDNLLKFYKWQSTTWEMEQKSIECTNMQASNENSVLAVVSTHHDESEDPVKVYYKRSYCNEGMSKLRLTFKPDSHPGELLWEILDINVSGDVKILANGGPFYDIPEAAITHEMCIENIFLNKSLSSTMDKCIAIRIFDEGLDGLGEGGLIGISVNGTMELIVRKTDGYNNTFPIVGNMNCQRNRESNMNSDIKRYSGEKHMECLTMECTWKEVVILPNQYPRTTKLVNLPSVSADGSVIAFSCIENEVKGNIRLFRKNVNSEWAQLGSNISVPVHGAWMNIMSLSADGSIIAISGSNFFADNEVRMQIQVFMYDEKHGDWIQRGNNLNVTSRILYMSSSKLSSDGNSIIVVGGSSETLDVHPNCKVSSYRYIQERNEWLSYGGCIYSKEANSLGIAVKASSNGLFVAASLYGNGASSTVSIYGFDVITGRWIQRGNDIKEDGRSHRLSSFSFSSDGSIVAIGGFTSYPIRVYKFDIELSDWVQLGQNLPIPTTFTGFSNLKISSNGLTLLISARMEDLGKNVIFSNIYVYDEISLSWIQSNVKIPLVDPFPLAGGTPGGYSTSADLRTIATTSGTTSYVYELVTQSSLISSSCETNQILFNFTILPDKFPEDISWSLGNIDKVIIGGRLPSDVVNGPLNFERCIPNDSEYFIFNVEDRYGDGICCQWGGGFFNLEWDNKAVINSDHFLKRKTVCLSNGGSQFSLFTMHFETFPRSVSWALLNSNFEQQMVGIGADGKDERISECLTVGECFYVMIRDYTGKGISYTASYGDTVIRQKQNEPFFLDRIKAGNCTMTKCAQDSSLSGFFFVIADIYGGAFSWELVKGDNLVIGKGDGLNKKTVFSYYEKCIPKSADECFVLRLFEMDDGKSFSSSRSLYGLEVDGEMIQNNQLLGGVEEVQILGTCPTNYCKDKAFFQLILHFDFYNVGADTSDEVSWKLLDANNTILDQSTGNYSSSLKYHPYHKCLSVPMNSCLTFRIMDSGKNGGTVYWISYNGKFVTYGLQTNDLIEKKMGNCN